MSSPQTYGNMDHYPSQQLHMVLSALAPQTTTVQFKTPGLALQRHTAVAKAVLTSTDLKEREEKRLYQWLPFMSTRFSEKRAKGLVIF